MLKISNVEAMLLHASLGLLLACLHVGLADGLAVGLAVGLAGVLAGWCCWPVCLLA